MPPRPACLPPGNTPPSARLSAQVGAAAVGGGALFAVTGGLAAPAIAAGIAAILPAIGAPAVVASSLAGLGTAGGVAFTTSEPAPLRG